MEKYCLKWNDFHSSITSSYKNIRNAEDFCDVTLVSEDEVTLKAHKLVLSSSSSFFKHILLNNPHQHPLLYLSGINSIDLNFILDYIYQGEVQLFQEQLDNFLNAAQTLKIEGLMAKENDDKVETETVDQTTYSQDFETKRATKKTIKRDSGEVLKENVGIVATIASSDTNEIQMKVKELTDKVDGKYICKVCNKSSSHQYNMLKHIETHIDGISYNCHQCGKTFRSVNSLSCHKSIFHKNLKL